MNAIIADQTFDAEEYAALARALGWIEGFGAFFVECSPARGRELVTQLTNQLEKRCQLVELQSEIKDLRQYILHLPDYRAIQVLFILGLEKSFEPYIKAGYGGEGDYYKEDTPVPVLGRLNLDREVLCRDLPQLAVVFILPRYGIKYFIRRAPDFFDWRSGWFHFATEKSLLSQLIAEKTAIDYKVYSQQSVTERQARLLELADLSEEPAQTDEEKAKLYWEMSRILVGLKRYEEAITSYDKVIAINPNHNWAWVLRGDALGELGRYEEAIASCDKAIAINPNYDWAWYRRGYSLRQLGRYEEAIASYDKAVTINPNHNWAWYQRGWSLRQLGRYEEAITSFDKAVAINPNHDWAWSQRGYALWKQGKLSDAANSFAKALEIAPNDLSALSNDIELALVQQDFSRMQQRLTVALPLLQPNTNTFVILPFLQWLAAPQTSPQFILDAIRQLEPTVKIDWDFSTTQPALDRLTPAQQTIAYAFIDFFKNQCDFTTLQQRLNATYSDPK